MFYAVIDAASLKNPTILNNFRHRKVTVRYEPQSPTSKYHYIFLLEIQVTEIEENISKIQKEMLVSWYSFFWSETVLYIVFNSKRFRIDIPSGWSSDQYKAAQELGRKQQIPEVYLDFKTHFQPYRNMILSSNGGG